MRLAAHLRRYGGSRIVVINVPWYLEEPRPEQELEPEEIAISAGNKSAGLAEQERAAKRRA